VQQSNGGLSTHIVVLSDSVRLGSKRAVHSVMAQKLLLIDANCQLLSLVGDYLSNLGYEVHRARESDEAEALLKNYHYTIIVTGEELANFGGCGHNLKAFIESLTPRPHIVRLQETKASAITAPSQKDPFTLVVEKPLCLLQLGDLMHQLMGTS
jgi:DNA-binding NtrC family response regulator